MSEMSGSGEMRFVLVNGRTPRGLPCCALCREPIGKSYLRRIATRLLYCDHKCFLDQDRRSVPALQCHAKAS
jgi:hypothetical protein